MGQSRFGVPEADLARVRTQAQQARDDHEFVVTVYDVMFATFPELRPMFPEDLGARRARFADELAALIQGLDDFEAFEPRARALGRRHALRGVRPEHYPKVRDAIVAAVSAHLGEEFTDSDRAAWTRVFDVLGETMQQGADHTEAVLTE